MCPVYTNVNDLPLIETAPTKSSVPTGNETLKLMLDTLNSFVRDLANHVGEEVTLGKDMLDVNVHTAFAASIKRSIENPLKSLMEGGDRFNEIILSKVDEIVEKYLSDNSSLINMAYKLKPSGTHSNYLIALNEDTPENRDTFFAIQYHLEDEFDPKYAVRVQFLPKYALSSMVGNAPLVLTTNQLSF